MGCVSLRLVAMETQLRRDFKSATRLFSGLKERGHYTIGLECVYILSVQRMPGTWTDSWVEKEGFLMYGKRPCKKLKHSSQKMKHSSTPVRPLKWWVHNSTEESRFGFIGRVLTPWNSNPALVGKFWPLGGCGKKKKEKKEKKKEKKEKRRFFHWELGFETISFLGVFWG